MLERELEHHQDEIGDADDHVEEVDREGDVEDKIEEVEVEVRRVVQVVQVVPAVVVQSRVSAPAIVLLMSSSGRSRPGLESVPVASPQKTK